MRLLILLFLLVICARSQERTAVRLHAQEAFIGNLRQYVVSVCNTGGEAMSITATQVWSAVEALGMSPSTNVNILRACEESAGITLQRKVLLVGEGIAYGGALLLGTEAIGSADPKKPIGKFVRVGLPAIGIFVRVVTTVVKKTELTCDFKEEFPRLPNLFQLGTKSCVDYTMYGSPIP